MHATVSGAIEDPSEVGRIGQGGVDPHGRRTMDIVVDLVLDAIGIHLSAPHLHDNQLECEETSERVQLTYISKRNEE